MINAKDDDERKLAIYFFLSDLQKKVQIDIYTFIIILQCQKYFLCGQIQVKITPN